MIKKSFGILSVCFFLFIPLFHYVYAQSAGLSRPKLVVGIVVDQMRWDYLYRYYDRYGAGGFKRLLRDGFSCENTLINYLPSYTAVGHTVIFSGSVPAIDGIVGNDWIEQSTGEHRYCTEDHSVKTVGAKGDAGEMSPHNMLVSTVTDELRLATNFRSRVVGVSLKDRAAILPAGHTANAAFWFDDASARFITSTYYMQDLPEWAQKFNAKDEPGKLIAHGWNTLFLLNTYVQSSADNVSWEGAYKGESAPVFPHAVDQVYLKNHGVIRSTPFGNTLTLHFAEAAIAGYSLGQGKATDFLTINCASTDYVGHQFGPNSIEVEDTYLRLDKDLASFFQFLDQKVGKGNYLVFLTADHGAAHAIGFMKAHHIPADLLQESAIIKQLNDTLDQQFGVEKLVLSGMNYHINYDMKKMEDHHLDYEAVKKATVYFLRKQPGVQYAVDIDHIGEAPVPEPVKTMIINGYNRKRCGPVIIIPDPGWFSGYGATGTTHGNWNPFDTHIPLIFMGWGIHHGVSNRTIHMTDIAPTVAALLHIQMPDGSTGSPIMEITDNRSSLVHKQR
ncbi:MAG: alkaline phosphatase family protein [Chitinophagaceae bacterium]|nr:MAG: alkaline phosphatase family protein [Chitinophagaceae bacterium]